MTTNDKLSFVVSGCHLTDSDVGDGLLLCIVAAIGDIGDVASWVGVIDGDGDG